MADTLVQVTLPEMGESVAEGAIVEWRKRVGEFVAQGDPLVDVTTDKVDVEVPAPASGVITSLHGSEGDNVAVGALLAEIDTSQSAPAASNGTTHALDASEPKASKTPAAAPKILDVTLPEMGESVSEGSVVGVRVKVGDAVAQGDALVDVTTDKVDVEVPAPSAGVITEILAKEGDSLNVGAVLLRLDANGVTAPQSAAKKSAAPGVSAPAPVSSAPARSGAVVASHQARRIARKLELDLGAIRGSGPDGMVLRADLTGAVANGTARRVASNSAAALPPLAADAKRTPLKGPAAALVGYMEQSLTIPTATSFRTLPVDLLDVRRRELNAALKAAKRSEKISFTHLIAFAIVQAAREMPVITNSFRIENEKPTRIEPGIHLGLAVDSERKDGTRFLVVPVIKRADTLDFIGFLAAYDGLVAKARDGKLVADDLTGASFSLTNPGGI
ncbi:MAG TPA: biotin/lipoyl-containing protein, partial [Candidatus Dormibacteraeota bacterium]|nr:biotin/lipoyl-containing protein [Candidatus Dormibacteraeota bacterium]